MCLIVFAYKVHSRYPLILAANRDEFYDRPAIQAHMWDTKPKMLAGKDMKAGGTWLGVSVKGEFGAVTNFRDLDRPQTGERSRGEIIPNFLTGRNSPEKRINDLADRQGNYNGFNFLAGSTETLVYLSNIEDKYQVVQPGIHGISNAFLNTSWPKVDKAKQEFKEILTSDEINEEKIFQLLQNENTFPEEQLPDTGLSAEMEKKVSPIFIKTESYGTRCSSLLMIDNDGKVSFTEKTHKGKALNKYPKKHFHFNTMPAPG